MSDRAAELVALALRRVLAREGRACAGGDGAGPAAPAVVAAPVAGRMGAAPAPAPPAASAGADEPAAWPGAHGAKGEIALASDHGGFALKESLLKGLREAGYRVRDFGPPTDEACDYPDFALKVARAVALGQVFRGIMVDGIGIGSAMAAGKVPGVRAATCFDEASTINSRAHNDANVLCIGSRVLKPDAALKLARIFIDHAFEGGRHARRVEKIVAIEQAFTRAPAGAAAGSARP